MTIDPDYSLNEAQEALLRIDVQVARGEVADSEELATKLQQHFSTQVQQAAGGAAGALRPARMVALAQALAPDALPPLVLLDTMQAIEREAGRERHGANQPRPLDLDLLLSYSDGQSGTDITVNSELLVTGLDLLATEKKVDIISAEKLRLAGLEIQGPEHVTVEKISADKLNLGRSLERQESTSENENRAIFRAENVSIGKFSHIDGFTAIDTIVEDGVHVVYHRDTEGNWNTVTLLDALGDAELNEVQGQPMDVGGYYMPDDELASKAMRPSATLNAIIDGLS